eukprot:3261640-Pyramimonas_sp.AAC.1
MFREADQIASAQKDVPLALDDPHGALRHPDPEEALGVERVGKKDIAWLPEPANMGGDLSQLHRAAAG